MITETYSLIEDTSEEHQKFIKRSVDPLTPELREQANRTADLILRLVENDLGTFIAGYRWMCEMAVEEQLYFSRNNAYRFSSFSPVNESVYQNTTMMRRYMDGLLLSQVLWSNHVVCSHFYEKRFLGQAKTGGSHLEIGPGHGLLLAVAASLGSFGYVEGWDISPSSIAYTRRCLDRLQIPRPVELTMVNVFSADASGRTYDSVVMSEILEHLEEPRRALERVFATLAPGGRLYVNVPVNSPAIDHIFLLRSPDEAIELVKSAGFIIEETHFAPTSGYAIERAIKHKISVSVAIIVSVPA
jgi:2-polyprenyl-3-methyl-5-hydroxy-6-metoxy-1,4-benzoquinol methylase